MTNYIFTGTEMFWIFLGILSLGLLIAFIIPDKKDNRIKQIKRCGYRHRKDYELIHGNYGEDAGAR